MDDLEGQTLNSEFPVFQSSQGGRGGMEAMSSGAGPGGSPCSRAFLPAAWHRKQGVLAPQGPGPLYGPSEQHTSWPMPGSQAELPSPE